MKTNIKTAKTNRLLLWMILSLMYAGVCESGLSARATNPDLLTKAWSAKWITAPRVSPFDYGVYHFRKRFDVAAKPSSFIVHVTGDNRYQLYVNGERIVWGPARGDLTHWRYETIDIARYLKPGRNVLAAVVWNFGQHAPEAQATNQTGFLLQGDTKAEQVVDTNGSWKCLRNEAYQPLPVTHGEMRGYFVAGPGEEINAEVYPWGWERIDFDDAAWLAAAAGSNGAPRAASDGPNRWMLVPRGIPLMEEKPERLQTLRQSSGVTAPPTFPREPSSFQVPAQTKARLLLDQTYLTTAYPELSLSGGRGAKVSLRYAESLYLPDGGRGQKGHRNEVEGKTFVGYRDTFISDGGAQRTFRPLWWRTYRYIELIVETRDEPLIIEDLRATYTGYPFERRARFDAASERLTKILDLGWRTARLCAHETYMDCPYYEQLQYVGDTRIQALVSIYMTGDARLMRNAIAQVNDSRTAEGATMSRAPTRQQQYIPPFSLWWVGMVHDYWMHQDDPGFVREMLPGVRAVLTFFAAHQSERRVLGQLPWWNFIDWTKDWKGGVPPIGPEGSSAPVNLQLLLAYDWATEMEESLGSKALAAEHRQSAKNLRAAIQETYWDATRKLYADTPDKKNFSQQANALAIIAGLVEGDAARELIARTLADGSLVQCSIYFRHYLHTAVNFAGEGDRYLDLLGEWDAMLTRGLTTWAETADPSRSDCHAWGASPNYELFHTVLGIEPIAPGFKRVRVRPFLGKLTQVSGAIPHPNGEVAVSLALKDGKLAVEVSLPKDITGEFVWQGKTRPLASGRSKFTL
ncbi:MAG: alpha-L-rhamnosidase N-terminal domain-containing protein [Acidobacteriota bacterium]|nr:alpha-L-rhamnosidase N-terminal domain-containing protein [Acidobacteriota bacterium]